VTDRNDRDFLEEQRAEPSAPKPPARDDHEPATPPPGAGPPPPTSAFQPAPPSRQYPGRRESAPPPGYQGYREYQGAQPGADLGPQPGAHRAEDPTNWGAPPRPQRGEGPESTPSADDTEAMSAQQWAEPAQEQPDQTEAIAQQRSDTPPVGRWSELERAAPPAGGWSYVDAIRTSELVRTRKTPPARGWRRAVFKASFGLINPGQSPAERRQAELEDKIRSVLRGHYKIGVLGKGGTGKTTIAACVGSLFARLRQDDRVVAIDADTAFGKIGSRVDPNAAGSYWELASDQQLYSFADVRSRVGNNSAGLFVLAGESSTAPRRRIIDPAV
jgi:hypothetical protein